MVIVKPVPLGLRALWPQTPTRARKALVGASLNPCREDLEKKMMTEMFKNSVLLSAHPDDEILWFSSIIEKVDEITICFLDYKRAPEMSAGRKKALSDYPLGNISCLEIEESGSFQGADWHNPIISKYGIEMLNSGEPENKYTENYYILKKHLRNRLINCRNIFTHNPWGGIRQ